MGSLNGLLESLQVYLAWAAAHLTCLGSMCVHACVCVCRCVVWCFYLFFLHTSANICLWTQTRLFRVFSLLISTYERQDNQMFTLILRNTHPSFQCLLKMKIKNSFLLLQKNVQSVLFFHLKVDHLIMFPKKQHWINLL